ncbi:hypothetical protein BGX23_001779 [Mortierella sp. AD031]|nr:hypothetical protein BGX23_001779 [Mortierella sp. AD031]
MPEHSPNSNQFLVPTGPARPRVQQRQQPASGGSSATTSESSSVSITSSTATIATSSTSALNATTTTTVKTNFAATSQSAGDAYRGTPGSSQPFIHEGVNYYMKPVYTASQFDQSQPTQIMDTTDVLSDEDESSEVSAAKKPIFARLEGNRGTMHVDLIKNEKRHRTFGTDEQCCDTIINHTHWPTPVVKEVWFKLTWKFDHQDKVTVTLFDLSSTGVYVNNRLVGNGRSRVLDWHDVIKDSADARRDRFRYTYKPSDYDPSPETIRTETDVYEVETKSVGAGMYSKVYRATNSNGEVVACKLIDFRVRDYNESEKESVEHEIQLLKELSKDHHHENIVKFVDHLRVDYRTYIFTEFVEGVTLHRYYRDNNNLMTERECRHIFKQTCDAVNYLHVRNVVHRDIKSENVMIRKDMHVKLIDFGLARSPTSTSVLHTVCGTRAYMAPETAVNGQELNGYGKAVDVWSLGVMLFRMLAGAYPFDQSTYDQGAVHPKDVRKEGEGDALPIKEEGDEVSVKKESDEAAEKESVEETDMRGVEQEHDPINYGDKKPPSYKLNWRPFVDKIQTRSEEVKALLNKMLMVDPSRRVLIKDVLRDDWIRMMDDELEKIDQAVNNLKKFTNYTDPDADEVWGMLYKVPGSFDEGLSQKQCVIDRDKDGDVMVSDMSVNGTYINTLKIEYGKASQLLDGDELGFIIPPDSGRVSLPGGTSMPYTRYLKYRVELKNAPAATEDLMVRRRYTVSTAPGLKDKTRKLVPMDPIQNKEWNADSWGWLEPISQHTEKKILNESQTKIGRGYNCTLGWDGLTGRAFLTSNGLNSTRINGNLLSGRIQVNDGDVIQLVWPQDNCGHSLGYTLHLRSAEPPNKKLRE